MERSRAQMEAQSRSTHLQDRKEPVMARGKSRWEENFPEVGKESFIF